MKPGSAGLLLHPSLRPGGQRAASLWRATSSEDQPAGSRPQQGQALSGPACHPDCKVRLYRHQARTSDT